MGKIKRPRFTALDRVAVEAGLNGRGTGFSLPASMEELLGDGKVTRVFYCDARAAFQKPHIERGHENMRKVVPKENSYFKAASFDDLSQDDISLMMSHVNSYPRRVNSDETSFAVIERTWGEDFIRDVFGIGGGS